MNIEMQIQAHYQDTYPQKTYPQAYIVAGE